jgi:hypothetical protein
VGAEKTGQVKQIRKRKRSFMVLLAENAGVGFESSRVVFKEVNLREWRF